jgi:hypothetical protein
MTAGGKEPVRGLPGYAHLACVYTRFPTKEVLCCKYKLYRYSSWRVHQRVKDVLASLQPHIEHLIGERHQARTPDRPGRSNLCTELCRHSLQ